MNNVAELYREEGKSAMSQALLKKLAEMINIAATNAAVRTMRVHA